MSDTEPVTGPEHEHNIVLTAREGGILTAGQLISYGSRFIITFVMARLLTAEHYGLYNLAISGAIIASSIGRFGLDTGLVRYVAVMNGRKDPRGLWGALQVGLGGTALFSILSATALFALAYPAAEYLFDEPRLVPLLQLVSVFVPSLALRDALSGATRGFKSMREMVVAEHFVQPVVRTILIGLLALTGLDVVKAIVAYGIADFASAVTLVYYLNRRFPLRRSFRDASYHTGEIIRFSMPLWLSNVMSSFRGNIQTILIGSLNTVRGVGIFTIADQLNMVGGVVHRSVVASSRPVVSELHDKGDWPQLARLYQTTTRWVLMLNLPPILLMLLFPAQIMSIFGEEFRDGATALMILAFVSLVNIGTGMCGAIIEMTGQSQWKLFNSVVRLTLSIGLNFLLIPRWGIVGAAVAALIVEFVANGLPLLEVWFLYKLLPYNRTFISPVSAALLAVVVAVLLRRWLLPADNIVNTVILMSVVVLTYGIYVLKIGLQPEDQALLTRVRRKATTHLVNWGRA